MDKRGEKTPTVANHDLSLLSIVFNWGAARGYINIATPCAPASKIPTKAGGRYITDQEYDAFYEFLRDGYPMIQAAMEIAYLCASRRQDVLDLKTKDVLEDGLFIAQNKTGMEQIKLWTPRLQSAVTGALQIKYGNDSDFVIRNTSGKPYTGDGFAAMWKKLQQRAIDNGVLKKKFRFHDLKVKGISDFEGDKQNFSGHVSPSMVKRYNRTPNRTETVKKHRFI